MELDTRCKSVVVYGPNGAGKSSFVDGLEYAIRGGRIGHLEHEYSGKRLERGVLSTHLPEGAKASIEIHLEDGSIFSVDIESNGNHAVNEDSASIRSWRYASTVLRQDEVADFIHSTKKEKYSVLLPLLGLQPMEIAAENVRQLAKAVQAESRIVDTRKQAESSAVSLQREIGASTRKAVTDKINEIAAQHSEGVVPESGVLGICVVLDKKLSAALGGLTDVQREHALVALVCRDRVEAEIESVRLANSALAEFAGQAIQDRISIMDAAERVAQGLPESTIKCPACGQAVAASELRDHVNGERARMTRAILAEQSRSAAVARLCKALSALRDALSDTVVLKWANRLEDSRLPAALRFLSDINVDLVQRDCGEEILAACTNHLVWLQKSAAEHVASAPLEAKDLSEAHRNVKTIAHAAQLWAAEDDLKSVQETLNYLAALEAAIRAEIGAVSTSLVAAVSADVRRMWAVLRPEMQIEDIHLYVPEDADKAIDVGLKFYGVEQTSPRLTLSEGNRNSLGLSIFMAMAKRDSVERPMILDDVVVSMDRGHRGMVARLLESEFADRQVLLFTHDRDWFSELKHHLDAARWEFRTLLPYETPAVGIRFGAKDTTFGDARGLLAARPDSAANDARKIMDIEMSVVAQAVKLQLPYLRGEHNERRTAVEFLESVLLEPFRLQEKVGAKHEPAKQRAQWLADARVLLVTWANRGSHRHDVEKAEAATLLEVCEKAMDAWKCSACGKAVWFANVEAKRYLMCQCDSIRWSYK